MTPADFAAIIEEISVIWPSRTAWPTDIQKGDPKATRARNLVYDRWRVIGVDAMRKAVAHLEDESPKITPGPGQFAARAREIAGSDKGADQQLAAAACQDDGHRWAISADHVLHEAAANHGKVQVRCARCSTDQTFTAQRLWKANGYDDAHGPLPARLHAAGDQQGHLALDRSDEIAP